jgi:hypothetical protein
MNEIMGAIVVNQDNYFVMFDVANQFEGLGSRNTNQGMQGGLWFQILWRKWRNVFNWWR